MTTSKRRTRKTPAENAAPESSGQADNSTVTISATEGPLVSGAALAADAPVTGVEDAPVIGVEDVVVPADAEAPEKEPSADIEDLLVDEKLLKEEEAAKEERKTTDKPRAGGGLTHERLQKLDVLLDQAQMYSKFLTEQVETIQNQIEQPQAEESPEKQGSKRKSKRGESSKTKSKKAKGTTVSPTAAMLPLIEGELRNYQLRGVTWLISLWTNGMNGILGDQMGLGKTVQTIGFLSHLRDNGINGPFLIVVPLSTLSNWNAEVSRWCPSMDAIIYHGDKNERLDMERKWLKASHGDKCPKDMPVVITSYEIAMRDRRALQKVNFKYMVVDEGHRLKNSNCRLVRELKQIPAENKLLLTGTPLQNNLAELWSLLNFLLPAVFNNLEDFESWFDFSHVVSSNAGESDLASRDILEAEAKNRMVSKLHDILRPFLLRRVKSDVETSLPPKREIVLYAPLTAKQLEIEKKLVNKTLISEVQAQLASKSGRNVDVGRLNNILMQLRKNCNHPDLITSEWEESCMFPAADVLVQQCGKMQVLDRLLTRLHAAGHKVLIFSQFTRMLDVLDAYLEDRGHSVVRIDGSMSYLTRMEHIDTFNNNTDCFAFLLSTRAGGLGINLTSADTVIIYDSDWNPHQDMQAMDRAHRIGQTKPVLVLRLCTCNSVEVKLLQRATSKLALERLVIKKGAFVGDPTAAADKGVSLNAQDLLDVLQGNLRLEGKQQNQMVTDDMMDTLLDRSHLYAATCPYGDDGLGYEVVQQQSSGLLSSVQ